MRVAIDATDAFASRVTGTGVYVRNLGRALLSAAPPDEITLLGIRSLAAELSFAHPSSIRLLRSPRARTLWSLCRLPLHLAAETYDVVHFVDHKLPRWIGARTVVTIHDTAFLRFPETFLPGHRRRLTWFTRDAVRRADHVIAVSGATRDDLSTWYGIRPDSITVIHHAVDHVRYHPGVPPHRHTVPYVLAVGALHPRKNYKLLMRAFRRAAAGMTRRVDLLIVGQRAWMWEEIEEEARREPLAERIHLVGFVPDAELPSYYTGAEAVLLPSLYEGFGIPALEAMASGVPLLAARASALPEIVGEAGLLLPPDDEEAWAAALCTVLLDRELASELRRKGEDRARHFTWERAAHSTVEVYRMLAGRAGSDRERRS